MIEKLSPKTPPVFRACDFPNCTQAGEFPAPKVRRMPKSFLSKHAPHTPFIPEDDTTAERLYFCLEHVRDYNLKWDFFAGMTAQEIEDFQADALTGHRQSNPREAGLNEEKLRAKAEKLRRGEHHRQRQKSRTPDPSLSPEQQAMLLLRLEYPVTPQAIKRQYRKLVKQYHPDAQQHLPAHKRDDTMFQKLHQAYTYLMKQT